MDSQACLNQQIASAVTFSINPLYSLEQNIGSINNVYKRLLNNKKVDKSVIHDLVDGKTLFYNHLKDECALVLKESSGPHKDAINIITGANKSLQAGKINILTVIEGIHSLFPDKQTYQGTFNNAFFNHLNQALVDLFPAYLTLSHMHQNNLVSFCNGVKMSSKSQGEWFVSHDIGKDGLTRNAKRVLKICDQNKVLIDLKHTSFADRLAVYESFKINKMMAPIASHCGATFMTFKEYLFDRNVEKTIKRIKPFPNGKDGDVPAVRTVNMVINRKKGPLIFGEIAIK